MTLKEKIIIFRTFSGLHFKETRFQSISNKESLKNGNKKEPGGQIGCYIKLQTDCFLAKLES